MYYLAYSNINALTFDIFSLFLVQIRIVSRQYFDAMIK